MPSPRVAVCGGGAIGASLAYFLAARGAAVTVIERRGIACAASGKSGGFLARDWCDGSPLGPLARRSFALHAELAAALEGDWGYRRLDTLAVVAGAEGGPGAELGAYRRHAAPDWLGAAAAVHGQLGGGDTTAQVDPGRFTRAMMAAAGAHGAVLRIGEVEGIALSADGSAVRGVVVEGDTLAVDAVVVAMGPWSGLAAGWLPLPMVQGLKGHSVVLRPERAISAHALFVEYLDGDGQVHSPEVFPRADGTTYVCGLSSQDPVPLDPAAVATSPDAQAALKAMIERFAPALNRGRVEASQACFRPVTADGLPLIGRAPGVAGAYVATGHSVWGILNAPASGEALAELILDGTARHVDLSAFDPGRLPALPPERALSLFAS